MPAAAELDEHGKRGHRRDQNRREPDPQVIAEGAPLAPSRTREQRGERGEKREQREEREREVPIRKTPRGGRRERHGIAVYMAETIASGMATT